VRATVVASEFLGEADRVVVEVGDLRQPVALRVTGGTRLTPGDSIHLDVDTPSVVVVPDDEHSIAS
jgi:hypothetical protein